MNSKKFSEAMNEIDDKYVEEAINYQKKHKNQSWMKWASVAACLTIVISVATFYHINETHKEPNLPMITLDTDLGSIMGFEGYLAYNIDDLTNANPWSINADITHLPVINNKVTYSEEHIAQSPDYVLMETILEDAAISLGMEVESLIVTNDIPSEEQMEKITEKMDGDVPDGYFDIRKMLVEDENYKVEVDTSYAVTVYFNSPLKLPDQYNFTHHATYDETFEVAKYLEKEYAEFIGMDSPTINISGGDFNIHAQQLYSISFFESGADDVQDILNYHFNYVTFACNENGELYIAKRYYTDLSDVVGEYPIIDVDEAIFLLESGNYITDVPRAFSDKDDIRKVELVYRNNSHEKIFVPYYRFYVELPNFNERAESINLNTYGAYYVPAVEGQYIENMPIQEGYFR